MKEFPEQDGGEASVVWERPEPVTRPAPSPLSRERIIAAAIGIADREGLASVSLRRVAGALNAGPMRLYGYLSTKEELLDLMVDDVYGEMAATAPDAGDWREAPRWVARAIRRVAKSHQWFIDLLAGRPQFGPKALAFRETAFGALNGAPGFEDIDLAMQAMRTVMAYVIGAMWSETTELRAEQSSGMDQTAWQAASWPYIRRMIATGRFPMLEKITREASHPPADVVFAQGLEWVLDGIATRLPRSG